MKRLSNFYKLKFTTVRVNYGGEKVIFSLMKELTVTPDLINDDLVGQAKKYGFCLMLHKKLLTQFEKDKVQLNKVYGELFFRAKSLKHEGGRPYSDDLAKAWVEKHPRYIKAQLACIKSRDDADTIYSCIKAFEQRKDLIQSISSNLRNEK